MMSAQNPNSPRNDETVSVTKDNSGEYSKSSWKDKKVNFVKGNSTCMNKCGNGLYIKRLKKAAVAAKTMTTNLTMAISIPPALKTIKEYRTF